jgi:hypothetical protein
VSIEDVAVSCAMTADALKRGGSGDPEPLWNMMVMMAAFTDDPVRAAHALSDQDPRYVKADTDRKLNEKLNARAANPNIGWPKCSFFSTMSPHCRSCPLLVQQKSPLNFAKRPSAAPVGAPPQIGSDELVPAPYWRDARGHLFFNFTPEVQEGAIAQTEAIDLFDRPVLDAGIDETNNQLVFKTIIMHTEVWVQVPSGTNSQVAPLIKALGSAPLGGINIQPFKHKFVRDFTVAWISHLQQHKRTVTAQSYGWADDEQSFSFGETRYTPQGPERAFLGKAFDSRYKELGALQAWQTAMSLAYGNMPLETVVATAFAAPLAALMGNTSSVFSVYSAESGVGKSTALKLGQAVWGHPVNGMSSLDDTANSVKQKISDLKSLPIYWDELITADALDKVVNLVFSFTQGKGKSRLSRDSTQMPTNAYATMFTVASNHGIGTRMYSGTEGTEAGGLRIFEIQAAPVSSRIPGPLADQMMLALSTNYGKAGAVYAKSIVEEKALVEKTLNDMSIVLDKAFSFDQKERFWRVAMTVLLTGATLANRLKLTTFNIPGMFKFLGDQLEIQRSKLRSKADSTMSSAEAILGVMNQMMAEMRGKSMITTEFVPLLGAGGRPPRQQLVDMDTTKLENVWIHMGTLDGRIRLKQREFDNWLFKRRLNPDQVVRLLSQYYIVAQDRAQIGAGVPMVDASTQGLTGRSMCYDLTPITAPGSNPGSP